MAFALLSLLAACLMVSPTELTEDQVAHPGLPKSDFADAYASDLCALAQECGVLTDQDEEACAAELAATIEADLESCEYDAQAAQDCVDAIGAVGCEVFDGDVDLDSCGAVCV